MDRPTDSYRELNNLGQHVSHMLRDAMNAFARLDVDEALAVIEEDAQVDEEYDTGPIVLQEPVPVMQDDTPETLAARVLRADDAQRGLHGHRDHGRLATRAPVR